MNLIIERKHTEGITFDNRKPGALIRAAREQLPELNLVEENDGFCYDKNHKRYEFNNSDDAGYSRNTFAQLKNKQIKQIVLSLELNNIY